MHSTFLLSLQTGPVFLPSGWYKTFISHAHGLARGLYTAGPGPAPRIYSALGFLGLTFVVHPRADDRQEESWDWDWGFKQATKVAKVTAVAEDRRRSAYGMSGEGITQDVQFRPRDVAVDVRESHEIVLSITAQEVDANNTLSITRKRKVVAHRPPLDQASITPPLTEGRKSRPNQRAKVPEAPSPPQEHSPSPPASPTARYSHRRHEEYSLITPSKPPRIIRSSTPPIPNTGSRRRHRSRTGSFRVYDDVPSDPPSFHESFVPIQGPVFATHGTPARRNTFDHSRTPRSERRRAPSPPPRHVPSPPLRRAPSPPPYNAGQRYARSELGPADQFRPRRLSRTTTEPMYDYRAISPLNNPWKAHERALSPPSLPLDITWTDNMNPSRYTPATSYFQTSTLAPSETYPPLPPLPPYAPPVPPHTSSYTPYISEQPRFNNSPFAPATPSSPHHQNLTTSPIPSSIVGTSIFTISTILTMATQPSPSSSSNHQRLYKVRWEDTWETKHSLRESMQDGTSKYQVKETLEWQYDDMGRKVWNVRWNESWEGEEDVLASIGGKEALENWWRERDGAEIVVV